jgi:alpha-amylase
MSTICFYFQVHQPYRIKKYRVFDIGNDHEYFDNHLESNTDNVAILNKVISKCYLPTNRLLLKLLKKHPEFKISFSLSGVFLQQLIDYAPEVIKSFKDLVKTGQCEILAETFYHSLSAVYSPSEFQKQVQMHSALVKKLFGVVPKVFRNTELIYSNDIAKMAQMMKFQGIITEGADHILQGSSPNELYRPKDCSKILVMLKNYKLSDDIAFRFSDSNWSQHPLTANKFTNWIDQIDQGKNQIINLFMDYETFGEHQWESSGIFDFLEDLPQQFLRNPNNNFGTPSEIIKSEKLKLKKINSKLKDKISFPTLDVPEYISWADSERDLSAWRSNDMQHEALDKIYSLETKVKKSKNLQLLEDWRKLTTSDHFYYMCTKYWNDGSVHAYFSPYSSPYEAFIYYMNVLKDLESRILLLKI